MALTKVRGSMVNMADLDLSNVGAIQADSIAGDADTNTSITFSGSDVITIANAGTNQLTFNDGSIVPVTDDDIDLGTSVLEFKNAYFDGTVTSDAFAGPLTGAVTGNADTATALATARTIGGTSFDGTANIAVGLAATATALASARTIGGTSFDGTANIAVGLAGTATALATARTIAMTGDVVWSSGSFDGSGNVTAAATIQTDAIDIAMLSASGTASSSTFLRGDNSWTAVSTPITALNSATANELVTVGSTTTELDAESNLTFDGSTLAVTGAATVSTTLGVTGLITATGHIHYPDSVQAIFGTGSDAYIKFDGTNLHINNNGGVLYIDQGQDDGNLILRADNSSGGLAEYIVCDGGGGGVKIKGAYGTTMLETTSSGVVFNEAGGDYDFRIESDDNVNMFWVDASTNHICIGSDNQQSILSIDGPDDAITANISTSMASTGAWNGIAFGARNSMKGAILYERNASYARGRLVIAVDDTADTSDAAIADAAMYINNDKSVEVVGTLTIPNTSAANVNNESHVLIRNLANGNIVTDSLLYNCAEDKFTVGGGTFITSGYIRSGAAVMQLGTASTGPIFTLNTNGRQTYNTSSTATGHGNFVGEVGSNMKALSFERTNGGGEVGYIVTNVSSTGYQTSSDYRLKENVNYDWDATTRLKQLKPARFNWIVDETNTPLEGFLAHEVDPIVPEAVSGEKDAEDMQGLDYSKLVPLMVKTIQELEARITATGSVAELEQRIHDIEQRLV